MIDSEKLGGSGDRLTNGRTFVNVESLSRLKSVKMIQICPGPSPTVKFPPFIFDWEIETFHKWYWVHTWRGPGSQIAHNWHFKGFYNKIAKNVVDSDLRFCLNGFTSYSRAVRTQQGDTILPSQWKWNVVMVLKLKWFWLSDHIISIT